jgi:hypothetical protein
MVNEFVEVIMVNYIDKFRVFFLILLTLLESGEKRHAISIADPARNSLFRLCGAAGSGAGE